MSVAEAVRFGHLAAELTVQSAQTVRSDLAALCPLPSDPFEPV